MNSPLVSVLLPVYNAEPYLNRCLESLLNQTLQDFEVVLVDNGSNDKTAEIAQSYQESKLRYLRLDHPNLTEALNFGLTQCKAPIIARMDADDVSHPNRLAHQLKFLSDNPTIDLVSGLVNYKGDKQKNEGYYHYVNWTNSIVSHEDIYLSRFQESALPHPSVMFRKQLIDRFGNYAHHVPEDFELWNRWLTQGVKMAKLDEVVLDWHDVPNRLSRTNKLYSPEAFAQVKARYFAEWYKKAFSKNPPPIYVFGYSKVVRQKTNHMTKQGLKITSFLDVQETQSPNSIFYKEIEQLSQKFVLSYVSDRIGKEKVKTYLLSIGMVEGKDFYMME
jgi:glycosyltransferase involved in cell wall biosynthesis